MRLRYALTSGSFGTPYLPHATLETISGQLRRKSYIETSNLRSNRERLIILFQILLRVPRINSKEKVKPIRYPVFQEGYPDMEKTWATYDESKGIAGEALQEFGARNLNTYYSIIYIILQMVFVWTRLIDSGQCHG